MLFSWISACLFSFLVIPLVTQSSEQLVMIQGPLASGSPVKNRMTRNDRAASVIDDDPLSRTIQSANDSQSQGCPDGFHGSDCLKVCGHCAPKTCMKTTGYCTGDCPYYYLPPYCKTKLEAPDVLHVEKTAVILRPRYSPELNFEEIRDHLRFEIKAKQHDWIIAKTKLQNLSTLETTICGLVPDTQYTIRAVVLAQTIDGYSANFESPEANFHTSISSKITVVDCTSNSTSARHEDDVNPQAADESRCSQAEVPRRPQNLRVINQEKGVVMLEWDHPACFCIPTTRFEVKVLFVKTNLQLDPSRMFPISKNRTTTYHQPQYNMSLDLPASTLVNISVMAINMHGYSEPTITTFRVQPNIGFKDGQPPAVSRYETFIELKVPAVINAVRNSRVKVLVKGSSSCSHANFPRDLKELVNMTNSEMGWIASEFDVQEGISKNLTIGRDQCPLSPKEAYDVVVILEVHRVDTLAVVASPFVRLALAQLGNTPDNGNSNVWIIILLICIICLMLLFYWRRKIWRIVARMRQQNLDLYSPAVVNFLKSNTSCTSQPALPSPLRSSADLQLNGVACTLDRVTWNPLSKSVGIDDLEDYVKGTVNGVLESQFVMFPRGLIKPCEYGSLPENKSKNRYSNIIAYDETRVILKKLPNLPYSDYINANYVQGFRKKNAYIATQGPKPQTVVDFWRMVWQEDTPAICMLANIVQGQKTKCEQYWPEFGASQTYGDIVVVTEGQEVFADFTFRTFQVSCKEESRKIEHLHYTGWPDHTVPVYRTSVITYLKKLRSISTEKGPIIVHCSAGIGRTGTMILCDICLDQAAEKGTVDVLAELKKLRDCRVNMVDNDKQYLFVHLVLVEYLLYPPTNLKCDNQMPQAIEKLKKKIPEHIERLNNNAWQDQALYGCISMRTPIPEQLAKNRFPELAPGSSSLVYLDRYPSHDDNSDYISAAIFDCGKATKQYLTSQLPLPSTLSDFWRLVAQKKIELIISLQQPDRNDPTCCEIIPADYEPLNPVPFLSVELTKYAFTECYGIVELLLTDTSKATTRTQRVIVLTCTDWELGKNGRPPPPQNLVKLWITSENIHREEAPTLVLCHDGVTGCGLYLALSFLLERMAVAQECDVILAVQTIRRSRIEFVRTQEQFEYLYDAAAKYVECFATYANFS